MSSATTRNGGTGAPAAQSGYFVLIATLLILLLILKTETVFAIVLTSDGYIFKVEA